MLWYVMLCVDVVTGCDHASVVRVGGWMNVCEHALFAVLLWI